MDASFTMGYRGTQIVEYHSLVHTFGKVSFQALLEKKTITVRN